MASMIAVLKEQIIDRVLLMKKRIEDGNNPEEEYTQALSDISSYCSEVDELFYSAMNSMW